MLGLEKISSDIISIKSNEIVKLFSQEVLKDYTRSEGGQIDCLLGLDYAVRQHALDDLLVLSYRLGTIVAGKHPDLYEETHKIVQHVGVNHIKVAFSEFYDLESLGILCILMCGRCACGECHPEARK